MDVMDPAGGQLAWLCKHYGCAMRLGCSLIAATKGAGLNGVSAPACFALAWAALAGRSYRWLLKFWLSHTQAASGWPRVYEREGGRGVFRTPLQLLNVEHAPALHGTCGGVRQQARTI